MANAHIVVYVVSINFLNVIVLVVGEVVHLDDSVAAAGAEHLAEDVDHGWRAYPSRHHLIGYLPRWGTTIRRGQTACNINIGGGGCYYHICYLIGYQLYIINLNTLIYTIMK